MPFTNRADAHQFYRRTMQKAELDGCRRKTMAELGRRDLFFLLVYLLKRKDVDRDWLFDRCQEFQANPDGHLDLWAREHYKSTTITYGGTIQAILVDRELTVGIFSHTRPIAKAFLAQIMREFEENQLLKDLYPDVLWQNPRKESPQWSLDGGIVVKRESNPKEATVEAWGLVDGQPTSKHYGLLVYDDVVTMESVSTPEQIEKTTDRWAVSTNLGAAGGRQRYVGTRYHFADTWKTIIDRGAAIPRIHPATNTGKVDGVPVFITTEQLTKKRAEMGPYVFSCQMLLNPVADEAQGFKIEWLRYYDRIETTRMNTYLLCDPAGEKKKTNDYTVALVIALGGDGNYYLVDGVRDRLNLTERTNLIMGLHRKWRPRATGYEKYGKDSDIEHIKTVQDRENYRFEITQLGGPMPKNDRIRRLVPVFEGSQFYLPHELPFVTREKMARDLVADFIKEEYLGFPVCVHDDIIDCMARILDPELGAQFPRPGETGGYMDLATRVGEEVYDPFASLNGERRTT